MSDFFGKGPWPCFNATCKFYQQPSIKECEISYTKASNDRPLGTFRCECGFVYVRIGPDKCDKDKYRIGQVRSYGLIWEEALRKIWNTSTMSMQQRATYLGVTHGTVRNWAARLGLTFPPAGSKVSQPKQKEQHKNEARFLKTRENYRASWLSTIQENPNANRSELSRINVAGKTWLIRHDREWLDRHQPAIKRYSYFDQGKNWDELDVQLMQEVPIAVISIRERPGPPVRVSKVEISRVLSQRNICHEYSKVKLPLATRMITESLETNEDFTIRKIQWIAKCYREEGVIPSRGQLTVRASAFPMRHRQKISTAIDQAVASLSVSLSNND